MATLSSRHGPRWVESAHGQDGPRHDVCLTAHCASCLLPSPEQTFDLTSALLEVLSQGNNEDLVSGERHVELTIEQRKRRELLVMRAQTSSEVFECLVLALCLRQQMICHPSCTAEADSRIAFAFCSCFLVTCDACSCCQRRERLGSGAPIRRSQLLAVGGLALLELLCSSE